MMKPLTYHIDKTDDGHIVTLDMDAKVSVFITDYDEIDEKMNQAVKFWMENHTASDIAKLWRESGEVVEMSTYNMTLKFTKAQMEQLKINQRFSEEWCEQLKRETIDGLIPDEKK